MTSQTSIFRQIEKCESCALYQFQRPLLDKKVKADVFWVGLSAVKVECIKRERPLSPNTNSGKLISLIEEKNQRAEFYKTNLVKCLPLHNGKIRYPNKKEMKSCCDHLQKEISGFQPKLVFLLGKQVGDFLTQEKKTKLPEQFDYRTVLIDNTIFVPVHHPSYILVYKRKKVESYINGISRIIDRFLSGELLVDNTERGIA